MRKIKGGKMRVGDFELIIDQTHNLPYILDAYPDYGANLIRLARKISTKYKNLKIFDVGANIGDTIAMLLSDNPDYMIIGIEGDDHYFKLLSKNVGEHPNVILHKKFLGDTHGISYKETKRMGGTLRLKNGDTSNKKTTEFTTLDEFITGHPDYKSVKLLKIDTDGYDNQIIRGGEAYLAEAKPVIYFEYDKTFLSANGENGMDIFAFLKKHDYTDVIFFDNYGRFLLSTTINDEKLMRQLDRYIDERNGAFAYYDIVVFHRSDSDIARSFIADEERRI